MHNYNNSSLKRVQSEGKLLFVLDKSNNNQNINKLKKISNISKNSQNETEQIKTDMKFPTPPAMGISGRKIDPRDYGRLIRMKKASRSQPQLSELFNNGNDLPSGKGRHNINRNLSDREDFKKYSNKQQKSKRAPAPPTTQNLQAPKPNQPNSPSSIENTVNGKNKIDKENKIYAIVNANGNSIGQNQKYLQCPVYCEPLKSPKSFIKEQQQSKQHQFNNCSTQHQFSPQKQIQSRINNNIGKHVFTTISASNYADELLPQVAKHEQFLEEEFQLIISGHQIAQKLVEWYNGRIESLDKRRRMLERGIVALDSAVHEQKLNFYRAKIAEMNRHIKSFLISSDRNAFPGSQLNSLSSPSSTSPIISEHYQQKNQTIRSQVHPPPFMHSTVNTAGSTDSNDISSASSSGSLPFEYCTSTASEADFLRAQNQKLLGDVRHLSTEIEFLKRVQQKQHVSKNVSGTYKNYNNYLSANLENNGNTQMRNYTSCRNFPNIFITYCEDNLQDSRDTLL